MNRENRFKGEYPKGSSDNPQHHEREYISSDDVADSNAPTEDELLDAIDIRRNGGGALPENMEDELDELIGVDDITKEDEDEDILGVGSKPPKKEGMKVPHRRS